MELSIDAGTKGLLGALGTIKSSIHFLAKRKAAELAALKLGPGGSTPENNLEEHVRRFRVFDLNQIVVIGASQKQLIGLTFYACPFYAAEFFTFRNKI